MKYSSELIHTLILTDNEYLALYEAIRLYIKENETVIVNDWIIKELQNIIKETGDNLIA